MRLPDIRFALLLAITGTFVSGCATMSAEDCTQADWRTIGFDDGAHGETPAKADRRATDCAKHAVSMDRATYETGRDEGLATYCVEGTAYQLGENGHRYNGVCANHSEADFLAAYNRGRELHAFTLAASSAGSELQSAKARHTDLDARLDKYWGGYRDDGLTIEEHNTMVLELWSERKFLATEAIPYWRAAEKTLNQALTDYRQKVAMNDPSIGSQLRPPTFSGPEPWEGPTKQEAREMLQEVFSTLAKAGNGSD